MSFEKLRIQLSGSPKPPDGPGYYEEALKALGATPQWANCPAPDLTCDGLILCGGDDLQPALYGQERSGAGDPEPARDTAELELFRAFRDAGKPIFGICRGIQMINVALGGTLIQDLGPELNLFHKSVVLDKVHPLRAQEGTFMYQLYGEVFTVNSYHHQAVDRLGEGLRPCAWAEAGFVEAVEHETLPIFGVQFHPERMTGELLRPDAVDGGALFRRFLQLCEERKK